MTRPTGQLMRARLTNIESEEEAIFSQWEDLNEKLTGFANAELIYPKSWFTIFKDHDFYSRVVTLTEEYRLMWAVPS